MPSLFSRAATGRASGEILGVGFPGGFEAFGAEVEGVQLLGEGQPDKLMVIAVDAGRAAGRDSDAVAGGDVSEGIGAVDGQLDPQ